MNPRLSGPRPAAVKSEKTTMIRAVALATTLGALAAGVAVYTTSPPGWRGVITPLLGGLNRRAETAITPEDWPICSTMASVALDADWAQLDPDFSAGKKALGAGAWNGAIAALELAAPRDPLNADIQNYIGYAYRPLRQLRAAIGHYPQSLLLTPRQRRAPQPLAAAP